MDFFNNMIGPLTYLEAIVGVVFVYTVYVNFRAGLIRALGNLVGMLLAIVLAGQFYDLVAVWLPIGNEAVANIAGFIIVYIVVSLIVSIIVWIVDRLFAVVRFIPGLGALNKLGGAVIGFLKASISLGSILYFASRFSAGDAFAAAFNDSLFIKVLIAIAKIVIFLLPASVRELPSVLH